MSEHDTVLIVSQAAEEWRPILAELTDEYGYRVLRISTSREALDLANKANVDIVISDGSLGDDDGLDLLRHYRTAHPYIIRLLAKDDRTKGLPRRALDQAAIYQFIRRPLDPEQIGLVVKRALETRELARRH